MTQRWTQDEFEMQIADMININELRRLALDGDLAAMQEIILRLEAAEKSDAESLAMYRKARDERDALRAKIEQIERHALCPPRRRRRFKVSSLISRLQRPGYDLQKEQAIQDAIVVLRQYNTQSKPDCGEVGHDEGRCGTAVPAKTLKPVIDWLRNGCNPLGAADELEMLIAEAAPKQEANQ